MASSLNSLTKSARQYCCKPGGAVCPLLDSEQQRCLGYNSFYWRYFNCGRYPSFAEEVHYYDCRKWTLTASGPQN